MPMMTLVMAMCECQLFYVFTKKVQQYGAQCIAVGLFSFFKYSFYSGSLPCFSPNSQP